jgi:hypothetical protein
MEVRMCRLFRFTIRDLLWLTLVVAMALGWFIHERQLQAEVRHQTARAAKWRACTGALEFFFREDGKKLTWDFEREWVEFDTGRGVTLSPGYFDPSVQDD